MFLSFLFEVLLQFLFIVLTIDLISMSIVLIDHMINLMFVFSAMNYLLFLRIKSYAKLLIYSTIEVAEQGSKKKRQDTKILSTDFS